jgi:enoyl-CoA hydratase/carnithine racemase
VTTPSYHIELRFSIKEVDVGIVAGALLAPKFLLFLCVFELMSFADLGTVQRMPRAVANRSWFIEMMYTGGCFSKFFLNTDNYLPFIFFQNLPFAGRRFDSAEARANGLLSSVHPTPASAFSHSLHLAALISKKSPLVIRGIKEHIRFSDEHSASEGLEHAAVWNSGMLSASDIGACMSAGKQGIPTFSKL